MRGNDAVTSSIYDIGYQRYEGARYGRRHAILALYTHSLRGAFGLGRGTAAKVIPFVLVGIALVPALIALGVAAAVTDEVSPIRHDNYYGLVELVLALFCAAVATEMVGPDQRHRVLPLYFSRTLLRRDYALAKFAALTSAMLLIALVPQLILFLGNALSGDDVPARLRENADQLPRLVVSGLFIAGLLGSIGMAIAAYTPRRAYATGATIAAFIVSTGIASIIVESVRGDAGRYAALFSAFDLMGGFTQWFFDSNLGSGTLDTADLPGALYALAAVVFSGIATTLYFRRYERLKV